LQVVERKEVENILGANQTMRYAMLLQITSAYD